MTSELYTKKILLGKLREKSPSESDEHLHDADMHSSTPDVFTRLCPLGPLLPSRHVEAGFTYAWYKSNSWLVFATQIFLVLHCSSYPSIPMTSSAVPSNDVLSWTNQDCRESILFNSWGILYRFQVSSLLSDTLKWLTVYSFFLIRLLLHQMGTPSPPCFALFVLIERIESQSLNGLRTAA